MAKKPNIINFGKGIDLDSDPISQTKGTRRFTLNGLMGTVEGKKGYLGIDLSNYSTALFDVGFYPIGDRYIGDNNKVVILTNPTTSKTQIGIVDKSDTYNVLVDTGVLGTRLSNQCDIIFRLRRGNQRVIYWVDSYNNAKSCNLDKLYDHYNNTYKSYLALGGDPNTFIGEKWDKSSFDLIKTASEIPSFNDVDILETGAILPGSYNFAIQLADEDLNPTGWIATSNTVNIYNDVTTINYERIRGSRNIQTDSQSFARASKSIRLSIGNLDQNFPFYRIAIIRASSNTGSPDKVLISDLQSTHEGTFTYTGNDGSLIEGTLEEILIDNDSIFSPRHIEQLENRCLLAHVKGKSIDWCTFQKYASKISSDLCTKEVILNNINSDANVKAAKSTFIFRGYMPGEVYSFGIVYVFSDGYVSPTFHVPGKNYSVSNNMKFHQIDGLYLNTHNCSTDSYWGDDAIGESLSAKNIRHHRFPFRKEVSKPLVSTSTDTVTINRYRLVINITLNPAWTPGPIEYPVDIDGNPIAIGYNFQYFVVGAPGVTDYLGQLVDTDMGRDILIYDDLEELVEITPGIYYALDNITDLASYQPGTNDRFIITNTYSSYTLDSSTNTDTSEIFGIEFSNIERPHPDVIGFYIVRNERLDEDRIISDNAFFGPMTESNQYKSFGLIAPKQYYTATNCGSSATPNKILSYFKKATWFFNPEFQYYNKRNEFDSVEIEGRYVETSVDMPKIGDNDTECLTGGAKGVYVQDVQAGTSFNPDVNNGSDSDGFDLLIGYRNTNMEFEIDNDTTIPEKDRILYLNAASSQNYNDDTYYNVSVDNKIGMFITEDDVDIEKLHDTGDNTNALLYGSLIKNNTSSYSNFINRPYYKEHNNLILFGDNNIMNHIKVFNGDAEISAMNMVSSVYYDTVVADRNKKSKIWQIIAGAILVVAGVVLTIYGVGIGLTAAGAALLGGLAVSYGVSIAMAGINFEEYKKMVNVDYTKGLKDTVTDGGVYETIRESLSASDDTVRWFADRVSNIYIESAVPFGLRAGLTSGVTDFTDAPVPYDEYTFREYLVNKLTVIDREQGSGRLYKGYASAEVYDMNLDYFRFNHQKIYTHLPLEYDCCADKDEVFPVRVHYSQQAFQEERTDNYRAFLPNNYRDIQGEHGAITNLYILGDSLFIQTEEALWHLPQAQQERITSQIVSFIGTGDFFAIMPRKVVDADMGSSGTNHKWATIKTPVGVFSVSEIEHKVNLHSDRIIHLDEGIDSYFSTNMVSFLPMQIFSKLGIELINKDNPANPNGVGYLSAYDSTYQRIILTKRDYLLLPDKLEILTTVDTKPSSDMGFVYCLEDGAFYDGTILISLQDEDYFEDKSFTMSYSLDFRLWSSWHSYLPNYYITSKDNFYSTIAGDNYLWRHNKEFGSNMFRTYYGVQYPFIVEGVITDLIETNILKDVQLQTQAFKWNEITKQFAIDNYTVFNKLIAYNSRQSTGEQEIVVDAKTADYLSNRVKKQINKINISKSKRDWFLNEFRDIVVDYNETLFSTEWALIKGEYFIDKVSNPDTVPTTKNWNELQSLRDKFIVFRFKFDKFDDVNLITYFTIPSEQPTSQD
jgi:hypothetical protein